MSDDQKLKRKCVSQHDGMVVPPQKRTSTKKKLDFPWSKVWDLAILSFWDKAEGKPSKIASALKEMGIDPCPTYDQICSRMETIAFNDSKDDYFTSMFFCLLK